MVLPGGKVSIGEFWKRVKALTASIVEEWPYVVAPDGTVRQESREGAARLIVEQAWRLATPDEAKATQAAEVAEGQRIREAEYKAKQQFAMPKEVTDLVMLAIEGANRKGTK